MRGQLKRLGLVGVACAAMGLGCAHSHYDSQEPRVSSEQGQVPIGTTTTTSAPACQSNGPTGPAGSLTETQGSGSGGGGGFMAPENGGTEANTRTANQNAGASYGTGATQYPKNFPKGPQPIDNTTKTNTNATTGTGGTSGTQSNLNTPTTGVANPSGGNNTGANGNGNGANNNPSNNNTSTQGGTSGAQNGGAGTGGTRH